MKTTCPTLCGSWRLTWHKVSIIKVTPLERFPYNFISVVSFYPFVSEDFGRKLNRGWGCSYALLIEKKWDLRLCCSSFAKLSASIFRLATILFLLSLRFFYFVEISDYVFVISKSAGWGSFAFKIAFGLFGAYSPINSLQRSNSRERSRMLGNRGRQYDFIYVFADLFVSYVIVSNDKN